MRHRSKSVYISSLYVVQTRRLTVSRLCLASLPSRWISLIRSTGPRHCQPCRPSGVSLATTKEAKSQPGSQGEQLCCHDCARAILTSGRLGAPDSVVRGQKQVQQAKLRIALQLDDRQFIQMINDTGVILNRDHTKWNYDLVVELLEGPLLNAKRLDEAIKATKFVRRLTSFFHPYSGRFAAIKRTRVSYMAVSRPMALIEPSAAKSEMGQAWLHPNIDVACQFRRCALPFRGSPALAVGRLLRQHR